MRSTTARPTPEPRNSVEPCRRWKAANSLPTYAISTISDRRGCSSGPFAVNACQIPRVAVITPMPYSMATTRADAGYRGPGDGRHLFTPDKDQQADSHQVTTSPAAVTWSSSSPSCSCPPHLLRARSLPRATRGRPRRGFPGRDPPSLLQRAIGPNVAPALAQDLAHGGEPISEAGARTDATTPLIDVPILYV